MPNIETVSVPLHTAAQPYNFRQDNIPLQGLIDRILLVNSQVDIDANTLRESVGSVGSLAARLAASINDDGSLRSSAVDTAEHSIAHHTDGSITVGSEVISYVRMTGTERAKLSLIDDEATDLTIRVQLDSTPSNLPSAISAVSPSEVVFIGGEVFIKQSDAISWRIDSTGALLADTTFPAAARHQHFYDIQPTHQNTGSPNFKDYKVVYAYKEGSMRVFVNGVRLSQDVEIMVPTSFSSSGPTYVPLSYTEDTASSGVVSSGKFSLSDNISSIDEITVDFDILFS